MLGFVYISAVHCSTAYASWTPHRLCCACSWCDHAPPPLHLCCAVVLPGFYAATMSGAVVRATRVCPQKYWCPGGTPRAPFDPTNPGGLDPAELTIRGCSNGMFTQATGAQALTNCSECPAGRRAGGLVGWMMDVWMLHPLLLLYLSSAPSMASLLHRCCGTCACVSALLWCGNRNSASYIACKSAWCPDPASAFHHVTTATLATQPPTPT